jgi:L-aspartate oxidase
VKGHFPTIYERLLALGIDMTREPIPVVPAQHYTCGGVVVDLAGRTDAPGLYAAGEVHRVGPPRRQPPGFEQPARMLRVRRGGGARHPRSWDHLPEPPPIRAWDESRVTDSDEEVVIHQNWTEIRRFMWNYVGIVRTTKRLERAKRRIDMLRREVADYYGHFRVTPT